MTERRYAVRDFDPNVARPKSFDEVCDRLMELEKREAARAGRTSPLRNNFEVVVAILREKGVITDEHERLFERNAR